MTFQWCCTTNTVPLVFCTSPPTSLVIQSCSTVYAHQENCLAHSLTCKPPLSVLTWCKHRRLYRTVQVGWRKDVLALSWSWKTSVCVSLVYILYLFLCVTLCASIQHLSLTHTTVHPNVILFICICLAYVLLGGLSHVDQRMHRKKKSKRKKTAY